MAQRVASLDSEFRQMMGLIVKVLQLQMGLTLAVRLVAVGLVLDCLALVSVRLLPYRLPPQALVAVPVALAAAGALWAALRPPSPYRVARIVDDHLRLKERVLTALETRGAGPGLAQHQFRDTVEHLRRIEPLEAFPVRLPKRAGNLVVVLLVLTIGLYFAPNPMERFLDQQEQARQVVKQQAERIAALAEEMVREEPEPTPELAAAEAALQEAARRLEREARTQEEAMAALSALEQRLMGLQSSQGRDAEEAITALLNSLAGTAAGRDIANDLARGDYRSAAERLRQMGRDGSAMSEADRRSLARALRSAGAAASASDPSLGQRLQQGAAGLEQGQPNALDSAADELEQAGREAMAQSALERALAQIQRSRSAISRLPGQGGGSRGAQSAQGDARQRGLTDLDSSGPNSRRGEGNDSGDLPGGSLPGKGAIARTDGVYDPIFAPSRPEQVPSGQPFEPSQVEDDPSLRGPYRNEAQVPYSEVYPQYEERATRALEGSYIPSGLKDLVKEYFSSIAPR